MKYRVSLLPEKNRKRIVGKKKAEKGRGVANVVMLLLLASVLIVVLSKIYADNKLNEIQSLNVKYEQQISALQQYREINNTLQNKINLIEAIQVDEPSLYNFVAKLGNVVHPGISVTKIDCVEWKTSRVCTLTGTAISRDAFTEYLELVSAIEGVSSATCTSYTTTVVDGEAQPTFTVSITCSGGAAVIPVETTAAETTEAAE